MPGTASRTGLGTVNMWPVRFIDDFRSGLGRHFADRSPTLSEIGTSSVSPEMLLFAGPKGQGLSLALANELPPTRVVDLRALRQMRLDPCAILS